jgi:hypothetical protein
MRTEIPFTLPRGLTDEEGGVHTEGTVRRNEAYLSVLLLARTVTRIGELTEITPEVIEALYAADFDHLQRLYERVNTDGESVGVVHCPECAHEFEVDLTDVEDGRLGK